MIFFMVTVGGMLQWWTMVLMLCCNTVTEACLLCDKEVTDMLNKVNPKISAKDRNDAIKDGDKRYKTAIQKLNGIMDPTTMYRAKTAYKNVFDSNSLLRTDSTVINEFLEKRTELSEKYLKKFMADELCHNKCGFFQRRVMDCVTCKYKIYSCPSPSGIVDCGVNQVKADEGTQTLLNCFQPWHALMYMRREYRYTWTMDVEGDRKWNYTMEDSEIVLNQLSLSDQGMYQCSLVRQNGTVDYRVQWNVTVTPVPTTTHPPIVTLPAETLDDDSLFHRAVHALVPLMAVVTALSLAGSLVFIAVIGKMMIQRRKTLAKQRVEEENGTFSSLWARWRAQ
ncbi:izumo sperm-egg fusion protein 1 [Festucalex cinctus]